MLLGHALEMGLRQRFAILASDTRSRRVGGIDRPVRWKPELIPDPSTGFGMTDPAAWRLIAMKLKDSTQSLSRLDLDKPPGAIGYVMKIELDHLVDRVYVKFEFLVISGRTLICGRSFHL